MVSRHPFLAMEKPYLIEEIDGLTVRAMELCDALGPSRRRLTAAVKAGQSMSEDGHFGIMIESMRAASENKEGRARICVEMPCC